VDSTNEFSQAGYVQLARGIGSQVLYGAVAGLGWQGDYPSWERLWPLQRVGEKRTRASHSAGGGADEFVGKGNEGLSDVLR
jgi:hypothetical protein